MLLGTKDNRDFLCELDIVTMHVFLAMKIGMIQKFLCFLCFEEHFKKNYAAFAAYEAYLYSSYRSNCKLSLMLIL